MNRSSVTTRCLAPVAGVLLALGPREMQAIEQTQETFDAGWPTFTSYSNAPQTNAAGWVVSEACISGDVTPHSTPNCAQINPAAYDSGWIQSPVFTNGVGLISFFVRATDVPIWFDLESSTDGGAVWSTVDSYSVTNANVWVGMTNAILTPSNICLRLHKTTDDEGRVLAFDDVTITQPPAGVTYSGLTNSPSPATMLDEVAIQVDIQGFGGATNIQAWTLFRLGTNGVFDRIPMTNDGIHFTTATPIPRVGTGIVQYLVLCTFTGFLSEVTSPAFLPPDTNNPPYYVNLPVEDYRAEAFDAYWPELFDYSTTPITNSMSLWVVSQVRLDGSTPEPLSFPYAAEFNPEAGGEGWIRSRFFTNGIGTLSFSAYAQGGAPITLSVDYSYDGVIWDQKTVHTLDTDGQWSTFTDVFDTTYNLYLRIRKTSDDTGRILVIDNVTVTYPAARAAITNVAYAPGYPSATNSVLVSCVVTSLSSMFPAVNIAPTLYATIKRTDTTLPAVKMTNVSGNVFAAILPPIPRDNYMDYYIQCDFKGYGANAQSPVFWPAVGSKTNYPVRMFSSDYRLVTAVVNNKQGTGRLLSDGLWQAVVVQDSPTNRMTLSFTGSNYWSGTGYSTNMVVWGHTNGWKQTLPLNDIASTGQAPLSITGSFEGQYIIRFDEHTGEYSVQECAFQPFESWASTTTRTNNYWRIGNSSTSSMVTNNFESWPPNETRVREEYFDGGDWASVTNVGYVATNLPFGGVAGYKIMGSKITANVSGGGAGTVETLTTGTNEFVVQVAHEGNFPLRGIGTVTASYCAKASSPVPSFGIYLFDTNYAQHYDQRSNWVSTIFEKASVTNTTTRWATNTTIVNNSKSHDVIFAHTGGKQALYIDNLSVSEWYSETRTVDGWTAAASYIEALTNGGNVCRFEATRADPGTEQYLESPALTSGVSTISFKYSGATNRTTSLKLLVRYGAAGSWTDVASFTNTFTNATQYETFTYPLLSHESNICLRIRNTTPAPGFLLVDEVQISPYPIASQWELNNGRIDATSADNFQPWQFYARTCFLNSNRTDNINRDPAVIPNTNIYPYLRSPYSASGIGEISFWYRHWKEETKSDKFYPARLFIELSSSTNDDQFNYLCDLPPVINTNDYLYFRTSVFSRSSHYMRICNRDSVVTQRSRVCLDDVLVTAPMPASLALTNLLTVPLCPVYTDTVDVVVDVAHLFQNPSNISLKAYYAIGNSYAAATSATPVGPLAMTCIASNLDVPGKWYRYRTSASRIPTNRSDTYVRYYVTADYTGGGAHLTAPQTNRAFGIYPAWNEPLTALYTTNQAYYVVYSCPSGAVWINEINYIDMFDGVDYCWTNEYVELAGSAGANIGNWSIDIFDMDGNLTNSARASANQTLTAPGNHGFWVLGDAGVPGVNVVFTGAVIQLDESYPGYEHQNLPLRGALVLKRGSGAIVQKLTYGWLAWPGWEDAGADFEGQDMSSLSLTGSGTNYSDFVWYETAGYTSGGTNVGQIIHVYSQQQQLPTLIITSFNMGPTITIACGISNGAFATAGSGWYAAPLMSTNAAATNWTSISYSRIQTPTNATLSFVPPSWTNAAFYRISATNSP